MSPGSNPSTYGTSLTFTATVTGPVTEGKIKFIEGGTCASPTTVLQTAVTVNGSGQVTYTTSSLSVASHTITACYLGTTNYLPSSVTIAQTVNQRPITVTAATNTKSYDGTTTAAATPTITSGTLAGGDSATLTEAYSNRNFGPGKTLI